jgi:uncharacterized membrane protein
MNIVNAIASFLSGEYMVELAWYAILSVLTERTRFKKFVLPCWLAAFVLVVFYTWGLFVDNGITQRVIDIVSGLMWYGIMLIELDKRSTAMAEGANDDF